MQCAVLPYGEAHNTTLNPKSYQQGLYRPSLYHTLTLPLYPWYPAGRVPYEYSSRFRMGVMARLREIPETITSSPRDSDRNQYLLAGNMTSWHRIGTRSVFIVAYAGKL